MTGGQNWAELPEQVEQLVAEAAQRLGAVGEVLAAQARLAVVGSYSPTWIDVTLPDDCPSGEWIDGPLSVSPTVVDEQGSPVGSIYFWVSAGRLTSLEQGWYTDDAPEGWPSPDRLEWE